jgi:Flp pilus assembly protein protease CpaA
MTALIALLAICLFAAGLATGILAVVALAIRREERNLTLTRAAPDTVTRTGRRLTGLYVRAARCTATGDREQALA